MEIPHPPADWIRVTPCERSALEMLRQVIQDREDEGGRLAVEGQGVFSLRRAGGFEAYLSPNAAATLRSRLHGLSAAPSGVPPDEPTLKLEVGDAELWKSVVRPPDAIYFAA
jgi:hypothetical protein